MPKMQRRMTREEVSLSTTSNLNLIIIGPYVYDVSEFMQRSQRLIFHTVSGIGNLS